MNPCILYVTDKCLCTIEMEYLSCISAAIEKKRICVCLQISNCENLHRLFENVFRPSRRPSFKHENMYIWTWAKEKGDRCKQKTDRDGMIKYTKMKSNVNIWLYYFWPLHIVFDTIVIFSALHIIRKSNFVYKHLFFSIFSLCVYVLYLCLSLFYSYNIPNVTNVKCIIRCTENDNFDSNIKYDNGIELKLTYNIPFE